MICVAVTYLVRAGHEDEVEELLRQLTVASRAEPGALLYQAHRDVDDPRRFVLYEQYVDEQALEAHRSSEHFKELAAGRVFELLEERSPIGCTPIEPG